MTDTQNKKLHICMIVPQGDVHGGIAAVVNHYHGSRLEEDFRITYVESYCDGSKWKKLAKALKAYVKFTGILLRGSVDVIHIHSSFGPSFYRKLPFILLGHAAGIPVVNHIHGSAFDEFYDNASDRKQRQVRAAYGKCAGIIVLTESWKEKIAGIVPEDKITVISNFSRIFPELPDPSWLRHRMDNAQVLFLGVITEGKGMHEMPAVIHQVLKNVTTAKFVIGGLGDTEAVLEGLSPEERSHVTFPGWVAGEEKDQLLKESTVFFLPSHMEAMPMSILEAMGYGLPIVSTAVGGIPGVVEDGVNGVLAPVQDSETMAQAITSYLTDEKRTAAAGSSSIRIMQEKFSLDVHFEKLEKIWKQVAAAEQETT